MKASAKLNTPSVTGCTAGAAPSRSIPAPLSRGSTKKKSVDSATTSASVSGATAHAGSPGRPCHPGGLSSSTNQYAAPSAYRPAAVTASPETRMSSSSSEVRVADFFGASTNVSSPTSFSLFSRCALSCFLTSGATARMMEKETSPSFAGGSTTSRA
jgi:hypothetical protein